MAVLGGWPPEAIVAVITLGAGALAWPIKTIAEWMRKDRDISFEREKAREDIHKQGWATVLERDREIVHLRTMISRGMRRETAYATGCELLLIAMPDEPTSEQVMIVARARELFETALLSTALDGKEDGG